MNSMKLVNVSILAQLASVPVQAVAASFGVVNADISEALAGLAADRKKEINKAAASEILNLVENADNQLTLHAAAVVRLQEDIDRTKGVMAAVARAKTYGLQTQNFIPLLKLLGTCPVDVPKGVSREVPKDWVAAVTPPAAAPATPAAQ